MYIHTDTHINTVAMDIHTIKLLEGPWREAPRAPGAKGRHSPRESCGCGNISEVMAPNVAMLTLVIVTSTCVCHSFFHIYQDILRGRTGIVTPG